MDKSSRPHARGQADEHRALEGRTFRLSTTCVPVGIRRALGLVGAVAAGRVMRALLYGVSFTDPLTLAAVVATMCGVGLAAAYLPARRATLVDPIVSLREE